MKRFRAMARTSSAVVETASAGAEEAVRMCHAEVWVAAPFYPNVLCPEPSTEQQLTRACRMRGKTIQVDRETVTVTAKDRESAAP